MTRTARRSQRRSSLPATPWSILKRKFSSRYRTLEEENDPDSESASEATSCTSTSLEESDSSADREVTSCSPAFVMKKIRRKTKESDFKETKKTKLNGNAAKRFFQRIKQKLTTRRLRRNLKSTEVAPLLSEDSCSGSSDGASTITDKKDKKKKSKKTKTNGTGSAKGNSIPFAATDTKPLLVDGDESDDESSVGEGEEEGEEFGVDVRQSYKPSHRDRMEIEVVTDKKKRQNEARRLRRQKKKVCFNCRQSGHVLRECTMSLASGTGICFKCGSATHTSKNCRAKVPEGQYPYAKCFVCQEVGHLSSACPDNSRGLYPHGGCCKVCGSVEHLKSNCPEQLKDHNKYEPWGSSSLVIRNNYSLDGEDFDMETSSTTAANPSSLGQPTDGTSSHKLRPKIVNF